VHASVFEAFLHKLTPQVQQLRMGSPFDETTQLGPLINTKTFDKVQHLVKDAVDKGASVVTGGKPAPHHGELFFEPTVLVDVDEHMHLYHDEIFGPVIAMYAFDTEQEAVAKANDTIAGLAGYFYTRDLARAWRVSAALEYGMVGVNTGAISNAQAPFGGVKQSGVGREGSVLGLDEYVETKLINMGGLLP
jgi:succinate-semialdehyde dehydrogenase/glutarate-semialdehyde dehydrogenase